MCSYCRTCLQPINEDIDVTLDNELPKFTHKLMVCIPEIDIFAVTNAKICNACNIALNTAYNFKLQCRQIEDKITSYLREYGAVDFESVLKQSDSLLPKKEFDLNKLLIKQEEIIFEDGNEMETNKDDFQELLINSNNDTKPKGKYQCYECEFNSNSPAQWKTHCEIHVGNPYKCLICGFQTIDKSCFTRHHKTHTMEKLYKCSKCDYKTVDQHFFDKHLHNHQEKLYKCQQCGFSTTNYKQFVQHQRVHVSEKSYECVMCDYKCAKRLSLNKHILTHGDTKAYTCVLCEYKTNVKKNLRSHLLMHARKL